MFFAYIIFSQSTGKYYFGHTHDLEKRLKAHNAGKTRSTKAGRPWILHYSEAFETKSEAYKREMFFKSIDGYNWLKANNIT